MANYFGMTGVSDCGLGDMLRQQLGGETDEQRKRRLLEEQQRRLGLGSPATRLGASGGLSAMLGGMTGRGY
jgi:hypothetical protein